MTRATSPIGMGSDLVRGSKSGPSRILRGRSRPRLGKVRAIWEKRCVLKSLSSSLAVNFVASCEAEGITDMLKCVVPSLSSTTRVSLAIGQKDRSPGNEREPLPDSAHAKCPRPFATSDKSLEPFTSRAESDHLAWRPVS
jgi:hypothetical protein